MPIKECSNYNKSRFYRYKGKEYDSQKDLAKELGVSTSIVQKYILNKMDADRNMLLSCSHPYNATEGNLIISEARRKK